MQRPSTRPDRGEWLRRSILKASGIGRRGRQHEMRHPEGGEQAENGHADIVINVGARHAPIIAWLEMPEKLAAHAGHRRGNLIVEIYWIVVGFPFSVAGVYFQRRTTI